MTHPAAAISRVLAVGRALGGVLLASLLIPARFRQPDTAALRVAFQRLGVTWIKLGQALALRFDMVPSDVCLELLKIRNDADPVAFADVRQVIERELGSRLEDHFAAFEPEPYVVTALGQLHRARSRQGRPLVVKVLRPEVPDRVAVDLFLMRVLAAVLDGLDLPRGVAARAFVRQFAPTVLAETDYRRSVRNIRLMSTLSRDDGGERNVTVVDALSRRRVLTTELLDGVSVLDVVRAVRRADRPFLDGLARRGIDLARVARSIHWSTLNQILRDGVFHADMSPAGLLILPGNTVGYVDFGMVARISDDMQDSLHHCLQCLTEEQVDRAARELMRWLNPGNGTNLVRAHDDIVRLLEDYLDGFRSPVASPPREKSSRTIAELMRVVRYHRLTIVPDLLPVLRAMLTVDSIVFELAPDYPAPRVLARFLAHAAARDVEDMVRPVQAVERVAELIHEARHLISDFNHFQNSGRMIGISLRSLRIQMLQYGFWTAIVGMVAYTWFNAEVSGLLQKQFWLDNRAFSVGFVAGMLILARLGWRQGRRIAAVERQSITRRDVVDRSLGRVR